MTSRPLVIPVIRGTATATEAEHELAYWLARWIEEREIAKGEVADAVAGSLIVSGGFGWARDEFGDGEGSETLRLAALGLASDAHLSLDEWAAERRRDGIGPGVFRIGEVIND